MTDDDRDAYLGGLAPGTNVDHRGTLFTEPLLAALLDALRDPATGHPRLGNARFSSATFEGDATFDSATFEGEAEFMWVAFEGEARFPSATFKVDADFDSATFEGNAWFELATFKGAASFHAATFESGALFGARHFVDPARFRRAARFERAAWFQLATFKEFAWFGWATFKGDAMFGWATFEGKCRFVRATFEGEAQYSSAIFKGDADFGSATCQGDISFGRAIFERLHFLGPLVCAGQVWLTGAVFSGPAILAFVARRLDCQRTRWSSTAELRLRYATVDLANAFLEYPLAIVAEPAPFEYTDGELVAEQVLAGTPDATVRMASLRGVDAAHLVLADVDVSECLFTGTVHVDQLRLEGTCSFAKVPPGTHWRHWWHPVRFTQRRTLAEEHHWRANQPSAVPGWNAAVSGAVHVGPAQLTPVYRALRKAFEDSKNEPGAADFYYGELEMRRRDRTGTTRAERGLLHSYWLLSGYGLRASRALGWLVAAMLFTIVLLMGFGLPQDSPKQEVTGTVPPRGGKITFEIAKTDPQNAIENRFTGERFEKALNVTLNSVVFRSSGEDLTTTGTYIEMASRVTEPILLGLAVLAVRNRVKR